MQLTQRSFPRLVLVLLVALLAGACSETTSTKERESKDDPGEIVDSTLVLNGKEVGDDGKRAGAPQGLGRAAGDDDAAPAKAKPRMRRIPALELNADGTIKLASDPFDGMRVQPMPLPIEDDPGATQAIAGVARSMREVNEEEWDRWMSRGPGNLFARPENAMDDSVVKIYTERCGGARSVATGVVLANETVVTTVHAIQSPKSRILVSMATGETRRIGAMVRYLDIDDDIAVLSVPGLQATPASVYRPDGTAPRWGYAFGVSAGTLAGTVQGTPVMVTTREGVLDVEQPDGFAEQISDRSVHTLIGAVDTGYSGGPVFSTNDADLAGDWAFHGLVRARVPYRTNSGGIVVPSRLVNVALDAAERLDEWQEHGPGGCPQWFR